MGRNRTALCRLCRDEKRRNQFALYDGSQPAEFCQECLAELGRQAWQEWRPRQRRKAGDTRRAAWRLVSAYAQRRYDTGKEVNGLRQEEYAVRLRKLPDRIAAIVGKTFEVRGDALLLADDEAIAMIFNELRELDETLIQRNQNKRLHRRER